MVLACSDASGGCRTAAHSTGHHAMRAEELRRWVQCGHVAAWPSSRRAGRCRLPEAWRLCRGAAHVSRSAVAVITSGARAKPSRLPLRLFPSRVSSSTHPATPPSAPLSRSAAHPCTSPCSRRRIRHGSEQSCAQGRRARPAHFHLQQHPHQPDRLFIAA